jgi:hypothetical protein
MKNYLALAASLSFISTALYGDIAPTQSPAPVRTKTDVYLCGPDHNFEIDFTALLVQPTGSNLHYGAEANPLPLPTPNWTIHSINPDYHFGFNVGIGMMSHCTNMDLRMSWEHFHSTDSEVSLISTSNMIGPFFEIGPDASPYNHKAKGTVVFHFDQANITSGLYVNFGDRLKTNLFGGVNFARIKETLTSFYQNDTSTIYRKIVTPSLFTGAGPQLGMNFAYKIVEGFHLTGRSSGSLLVGPQKNNTTFKSTSPALTGLGITPPNYQTTKGGQKTQVVPGFEGNLGLSYVFNFCDHYMIKLEAGYKAEIYLNAIQSIDIGSEVITPPVTPDTVGVYARTFKQTLSNFALAGPYFTFDIGF